MEYRAASNIGGFIRMKIDRHFIFSMIKSLVRVIAGLFLMFGDIIMAGGLLIAAELIGVIEEMV